MDIQVWKESGILERYCLGLCSKDENEQVEEMAMLHSDIQAELNTLRGSFEEHIMSQAIQPTSKVKIAVMQQVYQHQATVDKSFPPYIKQNEMQVLQHWIADQSIPQMPADFSEHFMIPLPSTQEVTNFFVYAKDGHEVEVHDQFVEYLYVVKGSCTMYFENEPRSYTEGQLIVLPPLVHHRAVVTSSTPMLALVQRQAIA